ncbi:MAG TPA: TolC family protein, partial [Pyrinomonadaceae bacterium]
MSIKLQVINCARRARSKVQLMNILRLKLGMLVAAMLLAAPCLASAQEQTPSPPSTQQQQQPPAGTATQGQQQQQPGAPPPSTTELPPNSSSSPVRPANEAQQSTQPQTGVEQERQQTIPDTQGPRPPSPQVQPPSQQTAPGQPQPQTSTPAGTTNPQQGTTPGGAPTGITTGSQTGTPGQSVGVSGAVAPAELPTPPPPVAPNFEAPARPLPSAERVGVDVSDQMPITLNEAVGLALANNNDIDGSRINVEIAEYHLQAARGVYDPVFSSESYYESRITPTSSTLGGAQNGSVAQKDLTGALRFGGFSPFAGGAYQLDFSSTRLTTNNQNVTLNPQYPTALTLTYTQPLWRGL